MKKLYPYVCLVFVLALVAPAHAGNAENGNDTLKGSHYNLNVIGVPQDKSADMTDNNGHRIFVNLVGKTKIMLGPGEDYRVVDANGTDGTAVFQLPNPDPDNTGETVYSVWVRALGKPNGYADMATCASDLDGEEVCSTYTLTMLTRGKGDSKFKNVSKELLYIYALDNNGMPQRYPLFDERLQGYFWDYDNNGLKLAQFRFYEEPTTVPEPQPIAQP